MKGLIRITISLCLLLTFCFQSTFGSPLVFKVAKNVDSKDFGELGSFDATKYSRIRVFVRVTTSDGSRPISKKEAQVQLAYARAGHSRAETLFSSGDISRRDYDVAAKALKDLQAALDNSFSARIVGDVGGIEIPLLTIDEKNVDDSIVIDLPTSNVDVKAQGVGLVTFYVWGV